MRISDWSSDVCSSDLAEVPPQMIEIDAVGAIAILQLKRSITPMSSASGQAPRSCASIIEASDALAWICLNILRFQTLAIGLSKPICLAKVWNLKMLDRKSTRLNSSH